MTGDDELRDALRRSAPPPGPGYWDEIRARLTEDAADPDEAPREIEPTVVRLTDMKHSTNRSELRTPALIAVAAALVILGGVAVALALGGGDDSTDTAAGDGTTTSGPATTPQEAPASTAEPGPGSTTEPTGSSTADSVTSPSTPTSTSTGDPVEAVLLADGGLLAWVDPSDALQTGGEPASFPGPFRQLAVDGSVAGADIDVGDEATEFCSPEVFGGDANIAYPTDASGLLIAGSSVLVDDPAVETSGSDELEDDIRAALDAAGLTDSTIERVRAFRIDLDGDGDVDVVAEAQAGDLTQVDDDPTKYSLLIVRILDGDDVTTTLIGDVEAPFPLGDDFYFANALTILSFVDLDRDGNVEVIVDTGGFEATTVSVIEPVTGDTILQRRCGP